MTMGLGDARFGSEMSEPVTTTSCSVSSSPSAFCAPAGNARAPASATPAIILEPGPTVARLSLKRFIVIPPSLTIWLPGAERIWHADFVVYGLSAVSDRG